MKRIIFLIILIIPTLGYTQDGPINIRLRTGKTISTNYVYLNSNGFFSAPFVRIDGRKGEKIAIDQVTYIEGRDQNGEEKYFEPIRLHGSLVWGERTFKSEKISIFYTDVVTGGWNYSYQNRHFQYRKKGNTLLRDLKYANLKRDIGDYPESLKNIKKGRNIGIAQVAIFLVGSALVTHGIVTGLNDNEELPNPGDVRLRIPATFIAGAVTMSIPWLMNGGKQKHYRNALKAYR
ncbi:MAG: hypothetical protein AAF740_02665 [Bacteroidota bacterium]